MKILVTGAAGMLGRAILDEYEGSGHCVGVDLPDGDLTLRDTALELMMQHSPHHVVHAAAYTDVDRAESDPERAHAVNAEATRLLARCCTSLNIPFTYISTDYVFDGEDPAGYFEDAERRPLGVYGRTKALGEEEVQTAGGDWRIIRTSWLFGPGPKNFVLTIRRLLAERETLTVVDDQTGCPTYAPDLARILRLILLCRGRGIFHATNAGATTWHAFAREVARCSGADPGRILPCATAAYPTPARRPACSILRSRNLESIGVGPRPSWQDATERYIAGLAQYVPPEPGAKP
jgi:dTDP-4-dehydrorhamnose reductase